MHLFVSKSSSLQPLAYEIDRQPPGDLEKSIPCTHYIRLPKGHSLIHIEHLASSLYPIEDMQGFDSVPLAGYWKRLEQQAGLCSQLQKLFPSAITYWIISMVARLV